MLQELYLRVRVQPTTPASTVFQKAWVAIKPRAMDAATLAQLADLAGVAVSQGADHDVQAAQLYDKFLDLASRGGLSDRDERFLMAYTAAQNR